MTVTITTQGNPVNIASDHQTVNVNMTNYDTSSAAVAAAASATASAAQAALYDGPRLNDVTSVLADNVLSYVSGAGKIVVAVGSYVLTRKEGFSYQVAASGASDHHVTTAGGVKLYVMQGELGYNVKAFGSKADGTTDDTANIQKAINAAIATKTAFADTNNGGHAAVHIPQGFYRIASTLSVANARGLTIRGDGPRSTMLAFDATSSNLFSFSAYVDIIVTGMTLTTGTITFSGGLPVVNLPATRTNVCANFNSTSGGTDLEWNNCTFWSFDTVFSSKVSTVNGDGHMHVNCRFYNNNYVWDNTNTQAVIWSFITCKIFSTQIAVFNNPGASFLVQGGDFINKGTFFRATLTNLGLDATFYGLRFENYQNIDPTSTPKFLDLGSGGSYSNIIFDSCTARGGGILTGKTSASLAGLFNITLRDCAGFSGTWDVNASSSSSGFLSGITFQRCIDSLVINQTLSGGVGNNPINIEYIQRRVANTTANRRLYGRVNSLTGNAGIFGGIQSDSFGYAASLNASAFGRDYAIFCPSPYQLAIAGFDIVWTNNTTNTVVLDIYTDNTKATKIATVTTAVASGQKQVISIKPSDLLFRHTITSSSSPIYFEATAASNAGTCSANVNVNLLQI